ncbi:MAG: CCA tRNA nucleotidyltransferase [Alphaproteobacteria bacterium]
MKPAGRLPDADWLGAPEVGAVMAALTARGATARFVGGCVRDTLAGRAVGDKDIATSDPPETVLRLLESAGLKAIPTGLDHGTVTAVANHVPFEITTLRHDVETDGRRARVAFTDDWLADAARRDFTMNALYADADGTYYDPFDGVADLMAGRVRFVGDAETRIREDVLRILRFFRFHAHFGRGAPEVDGFAACRRLANLLPTLSGERVATELLKLLKAPEPTSTVALMAEAGILPAILPEAGSSTRLRALVTVEGITVGADPIRRLATLVAGGASAAGAVAGRLRLSNAQRERLARLVMPPARPDPDWNARAARVWLYRLGAEAFRDLVLLAWADAVAATGGSPRRDAEGWRALLDQAETWRAPRLPVGGEDVMTLGVDSGPDVGRVLGEVEAWWVEGDFQAGRAQALEQLARIVEKRKGRS